MNFLVRFVIALVAVVVGVFVLVLPVFVPYLFGLTGGHAVAVIVGIYLFMVAALLASVSEF